MEFTADSLKHIFGCKTDADLGKLFNRGDKAVSVWRKTKLPAEIHMEALKLMAERGIVAEPIPPYSSQTKTPTISPLVQGIIDVALKLPDSPQIQAKALQEITATFISSQIIEKE